MYAPKMPIIIYEEHWEQTESHIFVFLPLNNVSRKTVDVFSTPKFITVSYNPYLFEKYLFAEIDDLHSSTEITEKRIILKLRKADSIHWDDLRHAHGNDRQLMQQIRKEAVDFQIARAEKFSIQRRADKQDRHTFAIGEHMSSESAHSRLVAQLKETDKQETLKSLGINGWRTSEANDTESVNSGEVQNAETENVTEDSFGELLQKISEIDTRNAARRRMPISVVSENKLPAIRTSGTISFTSTPRVFATPQRESQVAQEEEWLRKQAGCRQVLREGVGELSPEERDPLWLKRKGDSFHEVRDYDSAVACYTHAIELGCYMPDIYLNRGLCHLLKGNLHKVLEDMSKALAYLEPPVEANRFDRMKAHWRRAVAFCKMDLYVEGLVELQGALKIDPDNISLQKDELLIKKLNEGAIQGFANERHWPLAEQMLQTS